MKLKDNAGASGSSSKRSQKERANNRLIKAEEEAVALRQRVVEMEAQLAKGDSSSQDQSTWRDGRQDSWNNSSVTDRTKWWESKNLVTTEPIKVESTQGETTGTNPVSWDEAKGSEPWSVSNVRYGNPTGAKSSGTECIAEMSEQLGAGNPIAQAQNVSEQPTDSHWSAA